MQDEETPEHRNDRRRHAEKEADDDLQKPIRQLVVDVHDGAFDPVTTEEHKILLATRRTASMMGRVAIENEQTARRLVKLTWVLVAMTLVLIGLTVVLVLPEIHKLLPK